MADQHAMLTFRLHKPWWTNIAFALAKMAVRLGYPLDTERFSRWLARSFKFTTGEVVRGRDCYDPR